MRREMFFALYSIEAAVLKDFGGHNLGEGNEKDRGLILQNKPPLKGRQKTNVGKKSFRTTESLTRVC